MKYLVFFLFMTPLFVVGQTYNDEVGFFQMVADFATDVTSFFYEDVPSLAQRAAAWFIVWFVKLKLYAQLETIQFAWGVAKQIIIDLSIMSTITAQVSALPQDVRTILVESRFFDGLNIILNAYMTKYVLNFTKGF